ncbi:hypothetical protein AMTRI_Chr03g141360 [Amborella trichopoda]|uniref:Protein kinase domain-containing protein n=1 Tax=Amborella trichopoda TaxID=13333 RepID=W1P6Y0_AMBTC|nr:cysteine-rich receptor-like protein kinase 2 [Amborella trichopoda]ERN02725.1 hypothetical protein AMTR_s00085p00158310 [Amborella trichopoda]|eukprot:XP_006841050.1 cysteine-rich receptor-like protein kinase 2 [Amborella trichopoda]
MADDLSHGRFLLLVVIMVHIGVALSNPRTNVVAVYCTKSRAHNMTTYLANFVQATRALTAQLTTTGFGLAAAGTTDDKFYTLSQCMGDLSMQDCATCFAQLKAIQSGCFPSTGGRVYLDGCFLRSENYSFFSEAVSNIDMKVCGSTTRDGYEAVARGLVSNLVEWAPGNGGYGRASSTGEGGDRVYGLANCWRILDEESCSACLKKAAAAVFSCLPTTEGRAMNAGCFLRYSDQNFLNEGHDMPIEINNMGEMVQSFGTLAAGIFVLAVAIIVGVILAKSIQERRTAIKNTGMQHDEMDASLFKRSLNFKYSTLQKATGSFRESNKLGQGGFGEVYKGTLLDGREIAVKRLFMNPKNRGSDIYNEMNVISRAQHKNLVRFLGCCLSGTDSLLVYEYLPNKSLDRFLFDSIRKKEIDWKKRLEIIVGTAEGLKYLHTECEVRIIHRDIKASNILLDVRLRPKIADFGLARFFSGDKTHISTAIAGTLGYMAPEYVAHGQLTEKADVYSFGVLVLEIISGKQNNRSVDTLVPTSWKLFMSDAIMRIVDPSMSIMDLAEVTRVIHIGLLCTQESPSLRPCMAEVVDYLSKQTVQLPSPTKPPFMDELGAGSCSTSESPEVPLKLSVSYSQSYNDLEPR